MKTAETIYLSRKGMKELKKTIVRLERDCHDVRRALRELDKGEGHDEWLERSERLSQLDMFESELAEKRHILANARLLPRKRDTLKVAMGSVVDLIDTKGRIVRYTLVDSLEANPSDGRISTKSPLGKSLLGKQIQEVVVWTNGLHTNRVQLVGIG